MNFRKLTSSLVIGLSIMITAAPARAGIPVIDVGNLIQSIQQTMAWLQQYQQMVDSIQKYQEQLQQAVTMTQKLDGMRSLGTILNDPNINSLLPSEYKNAAQLLMNPSAYSTNTSAMNSILSSFGVTGMPNSGASNGFADALGRAQSILASAQQRQAQLGQLASRVDTSADAKESIDLMNRNTLEVANISNQLLQTFAATDAARQSQELRGTAELKTYSDGIRTGATTPIKSYTAAP
jgi:type IV secretion system protein VirB5